MDKWFYEQARLGNVYHSSTAASGAFTTISSTNTGLVLENPHGSGKLLVIKSSKFTSTTLTTIGEVGLCVNPSISTVVSATTTAAVIHNALNTGSDSDVGKGLAYTIATLPATPVWLEIEGSGAVSSAVNSNAPALWWEPKGDFIVVPGANISWQSLTVVRNGMAAFTWAEIDE